jgi:hypothetical protein
MTNPNLARMTLAIGMLRESSKHPSCRSRRPTPAEAILEALEPGMIPVSDLPWRASLSPSDVLEAVAGLRANGCVEIVRFPEAGVHKFVRLTLSGFVRLATL